MWPFNALETVSIIGAIFLGLTQVITLFKVKEVHNLTNSRLSRIEGELTQARTDNAAKDLAAGKAEHVRTTLANEVSRDKAVTEALLSYPVATAKPVDTHPVVEVKLPVTLKPKKGR